VLILPVAALAQNGGKDEIAGTLHELHARVSAIKSLLERENASASWSAGGSASAGNSGDTAPKYAYKSIRTGADAAQVSDLVAGLHAAASNAQRELEYIAQRVDAWQPSSPHAGAAFQRSLTDTQALLQKVPGFGDAPCKDVACLQMLQFSLAAVADDLSVKAEHCRLAGLAATVKTEVRTVTGEAQVPALQVFYAPALAFSAGGQPALFPRLSSPTAEDLPPGRYMIWARDPKTGKACQPQPYKIGDGKKAITIDLPWE
jgi:hypothetical protein